MATKKNTEIATINENKGYLTEVVNLSENLNFSASVVDIDKGNLALATLAHNTTCNRNIDFLCTVVFKLFKILYNILSIACSVINGNLKRVIALFLQSGELISSHLQKVAVILVLLNLL